MRTYVFPTSSRSHPSNHFNFSPLLARLGCLEVSDFRCVELSATHFSLKIGDVPKMSITLSIPLRKGFLTDLDKSLKFSCHPGRVIHVKLDGL